MDLPPVGSDLAVGGYAVGAVCAAVLLAGGLAHYAGRGRRFVDPWMLSPYTGLAAAWLGAGGLLVCSATLLAAVPSAVATVLAVVLGVAGVVSWLVGLVGVVWLPSRLRPRWLRELLVDPDFLARNGRTRRAAARRPRVGVRPAGAPPRTARSRPRPPR